MNRIDWLELGLKLIGTYYAAFAIAAGIMMLNYLSDRSFYSDQLMSSVSIMLAYSLVGAICILKTELCISILLGELSERTLRELAMKRAEGAEISPLGGVGMSRREYQCTCAMLLGVYFLAHGVWTVLSAVVHQLAHFLQIRFGWAIGAPSGLPMNWLSHFILLTTTSLYIGLGFALTRKTEWCLTHLLRLPDAEANLPEPADEL